jgi:hypothetical protein
VVNWLPKKQNHMRGVSPSLRLSNFELAQAQLRRANPKGREGGTVSYQLPSRQFTFLSTAHK